MDGFVELTPQKLEGHEGLAEINRMLRDLYENTPGDGNSVRVFRGYGSPESVISASVGSIYQRLDGSTSTTIYTKSSGDGATGWEAVGSASASGTVTSVSVATANGVSGSVANATTTPAITLTLGAITPTTIVASGNVSGANLSGTNTGDQDISGKLDANTPITGATKTKITYDADGLVTSGADATTADIADSSDKRYVTDAQLVVIGNTSGTNTGDQTLPVKASGAELDTGTDDAKFATAKAIKDSHNVPSVAPGTSGNVLTSDGTDWTSAAPTGSAFNFLLAQVYS